MKLKILSIFALLLIGPVSIAAIVPADKASLGIPHNYITNGGFEHGLYGVSTFADAAGTLPVDGTGGSPSHISISLNSGSPLSGFDSMNISNSGSTSAQGEGVSIPFTIDKQDEGHTLSIGLSYLIGSGTFQAGSPYPNFQASDLEVFVYDVTNSQLIEPDNFTLNSNSSNSSNYSSMFQAASNSTSYRLIFFVPTTNTSAWSIVMDSVTISSQKSSTGPPIVDLTGYSPTLVGFGTVSGLSIYQATRIGSYLHVQGRFTTGTPTGVTAEIPLPSGLSTSSDYTAITRVGDMARNTGTTSTRKRYIVLANGSQGFVSFGSDDYTLGDPPMQSRLGTDISGSSTILSFNFDVKIQGWSSSTAMSSDSSSRIVVATYSVASTQSIANNTETALNFGTATLDVTGGSVTSTSPWTFTAQEHEYVHVNANTRWASTPSGQLYLGVKVNSGTSKRIWDNNAFGAVGVMSGGIDLELNSGDTVKIVAFQSSGSSLSIDNASGNVSIHKIQSGQTLAASDTVAASYTSNNTPTVGTSLAVLKFNTVRNDYSGSYSVSTGLFTCPISGLYRSSAELTVTAVSLSTSQSIDVQLFKNGSFDSDLGSTFGNGTSENYRVGGSSQIHCLSGETLSIEANSSVSTTLFATAGYSHVEFIRVGN